MRRADLAKNLIDARSDAERRSLLAQYPRLADARLADAIRKACYAAWAVEPVRAQRADLAMRWLARAGTDERIRAAASWVKGIALITKGKFEAAVASLDDATEIYDTIDSPLDSAQTQVAKLIALAMLGRYDEAVGAGRKALKVFVRSGDQVAAGKIEMNLSNIVSRRALHREAEKYGLTALRRFRMSGERTWQVMAENGLANTYAELNDFSKADRYYVMALMGARSGKMRVTEAEIEASLGNLDLLRGRYADALRHLESSRQMYDELRMPHQSAIADLEIADIYSELNLAEDAFGIYERVTPIFRQLKLTAEEARARLNYGKTAAAIGKRTVAGRQLKRAQQLFEREQNLTGEVSVLLERARNEIERGDPDAAGSIIRDAAAAVKDSGNPRHRVSLELLRGEYFVQSDHPDKADKIFSDAAKLGRSLQHPDAVRQAYNAGGKLAAERGEYGKAKRLFTSAIKQVEAMRSPLGAEEFSMAFFASRLEPFHNLARLYLSRKKYAAAFEALESGRSRALLDSMSSSSADAASTRKLQAQADEYRTELNQYYRRLDISTDADAEKLRSDIKTAESNLTSTIRQVESLRPARSGSEEKSQVDFSVSRLSKQLGKSSTLIEFVEFDGLFSAFVINGSKVSFVADLARTDDVRHSLEELHFQFGALRYGTSIPERFMADMRSRTDACLERLYGQLLKPIDSLIKGDRLVIVPAGILNYVPFHALRSHHKYVVESFETTFAPSAAVWSVLNERTDETAKSSLLMGYADERIPFVEDEIRQIQNTLPRARALVGGEASFAAFTASASRYDIIHLACHGHFRPESPMFSSLHLSDGWITVRDVCSQKLKASLVTLSACETGLSEVFAGDEILGLARGFLTAGAGALIVSLWSVNDEASGRLMSDLYQNLQRGGSISASLRAAQIGFITRGGHPYYWSPFILIGK